MAWKHQLRKGAAVLALLLMMQVMLHPFVHAMPLPMAGHSVEQPAGTSGSATPLHGNCLLCPAGAGLEAPPAGTVERPLSTVSTDWPEAPVESPRKAYARPSLGRAPPQA